MTKPYDPELDGPDRSVPPCQECGAKTVEEAHVLCICNGDKDDCHGVQLWPDAGEAPAHKPVSKEQGDAIDSALGLETVSLRMATEDLKKIEDHAGKMGVSIKVLVRHILTDWADSQDKLPTGPAYGIIDPDYARVYTQARIVAWSYGYACVMHGSFTRDLDLLLVPWTDRAHDNYDQLLKLIAQSANLQFSDGKEDILESTVDWSPKPHGRMACSLYFPAIGDRRWIDISVMPVVPKAPT